MTPITLHQWPGLSKGVTMSPPCDKVHMALRFKGLDYETRNARGPGGAKKVNPRGRLPALELDGRMIVDSSDILTALDERFPDPPLVPTDARSRALCQVFEDWADENIYFQLAYLRWVPKASFAHLAGFLKQLLPPPLSLVVPRLARRDALARFKGQGIALKPEETVRRELDDALDALACLVEPGPFLLGEALSRADISVAAEVEQLRSDITPEARRSVERRQPLVAWLDRVAERAPSTTRQPHR